jgi:hypothetical protein
MTIPQILILIVAVVFVILGGLVVFSDKFYSYMMRTWWAPCKLDKALFPSGGNIYNRYGRGLGTLIGGIIIILWWLVSLFT